MEFAERLVVENALSAIEHGARVITHAGVKKLIVQDEQLTARIIYRPDRNCPGYHQRRGTLGRSSSSISELPRPIGGTKGSHIVVAPFTGAPEKAIYIEAKTDQRPFFIIPWNSNYLIGTTDFATKAISITCASTRLKLNTFCEKEWCLAHGEPKTRRHSV